MLSSGRYIYVVFLCHLALEKLLKGLATEVSGRSAPRSHDLIFLMKQADTQLEPTLYEFVSKLNNASVPTRYPDDLQRAISEYTEQVATYYLRQTKEVAQ